MNIQELDSGKILIVAYDNTSKIASIYSDSVNGGNCVKLNTAVGTNSLITTLRQVVISPDKKKILVNLSVGGPQGANGTVIRYEDKSNQLLHVPLDGRPSLVVNTPLFKDASISQFTFLNDSQSVLYLGNQFDVTNQNVFLWKAP